MAFVDEVTLHLRAGDGGNGVVRWRHEKFKEFSGPSGGDGGWGGDVYIRGVRDIARLSHYAQFTELSAEDGQGGMKDSRTGKRGEDLVLDLPTGSVVTNMETGERFEVLSEGHEIRILRGGRGGLGNEHFKSSRNTRPEESTDGKPGQEADFHIELRLIADVGFVGLPNAGKSTLLNELTGAKSKVGSYTFTTLEPHLGDLHGVILADIPGLIEGASGGRGLGQAFLRHIQRTRLLLHCVSLESDDPVRDYRTIREELSRYGSDLDKKPEIVLLTKRDAVDEKTLASWSAALSSESGAEVCSVSILDDASVDGLKRRLVDVARAGESESENDGDLAV